MDFNFLIDLLRFMIFGLLFSTHSCDIDILFFGSVTAYLYHFDTRTLFLSLSKFNIIFWNSQNRDPLSGFVKKSAMSKLAGKYHTQTCPLLIQPVTKKSVCQCVLFVFYLISNHCSLTSWYSNYLGKLCCLECLYLVHAKDSRSTTPEVLNHWHPQVML